MDINDRIKELGDFFKGMQVTTEKGEPIIYVEISYPKTWEVDKAINEKYNVSTLQGSNYPGQYFFGAEMEVGFDAIFDCIEENIKKMKAIVERGNLFKKKTEELKNLFQDETVTIEELRSLRFIYTTNDGIDYTYRDINEEIQPEFSRQQEPVSEDTTNNKKKKKELNE